MTIYPVEAVAAQAAPKTVPAGNTAPVDFSDWLAEQVRGVNTELIAADDGVRRMAVGDPVNLHQVMINLERAKLRFDLVLQVRNKLMEAYQDLVRMQI